MLHHFIVRRVIAALVIGSSAVAFVGCGKVGSSAARSNDAQIAARVNDEDITVHQVQHALQRARASAESGEAAARRALDQLVEQELSAQAARANGLDREPGVIQALEAARREVLARAWQDRLASVAARPNSDEIDRYYAEHPGLFSQRRVYVLQESLVEAKDADHSRVQQFAREAASARELEDKLDAARLRYRARRFAQNAEDLPLALVEPLGKLAVGRSLVLPLPAGLRVYTVLYAETTPVDQRIATSAIDSFIQGERKRQAVIEGMKPIREKARIDYRGSFAQPVSAAASGAAGRGSE